MKPTENVSPERAQAVRSLDSLARRYQDIRVTTERLAEVLSPEDCALQSMPDASPVKWHLAHTSWFFETFVLEPGLPGYKVFHPGFRALFNSYYETVGEKHPRPERGQISRPGLEEVLSYRAHVDRSALEFLRGRLPRAGAAACRDRGIGLRDLMELGLNHEQQHQELILTDVKHLFSKNPLLPVYAPIGSTGGATAGSAAPGTPTPGRTASGLCDSATSPVPGNPAYSGGGVPGEVWKRWDEGIREIGHRGAGFAFDNESPRHRALMPAFEIAQYPVTNEEYIAFIDDRGYERPELWLSDGWDAVRAQQWRSPLYWEERDGERWTFTLRGFARLDPREPVCHVSYYEADAYARWKGARLATEYEWETAATASHSEGNWLEDGRFHPAPSRHPAGMVSQMMGGVWEWTRSPYEPYPGYRAAPGAMGEYNGKFMCNQRVLRGGSCATPRSHIRPTYRNFFPPSARWQFSGIRLARDAS